MKDIHIFILSFLLVSILHYHVDGQCLDIIKNNCKKKLEQNSYIFNGQINGVILTENETIELFLTFYGGQNYRLFVCSDESLGKVKFNLKDSKRKLVFSNKDYDLTNQWDFTSGTTQEMIVEVSVPDNNDGKIQQGCVSILVGFK